MLGHSLGHAFELGVLAFVGHADLLVVADQLVENGLGVRELVHAETGLVSNQVCDSLSMFTSNN